MIYAGFSCGSYIPKPGSDVLTMVYANPGTGSTSNGREIFSTTYIDILMCDVSFVGINENWTPPDICISHVLGGIDVALTDADGIVGVALYFYVMRQDGTGKLALMASRAGDYRTNNPPGWWPIRQLRFTSVWKLGRGKHWNGLGNFFQCVDNSEVLLTGSGGIVHYQMLPPSKSKTDRDLLSIAPWVANDVRWITVHATVYSAGSAGTAYLYASPVSEKPFNVGQVIHPYDRPVCFMDMMPDSSGNIAWCTEADALLELHLYKYRHSNPT